MSENIYLDVRRLAGAERCSRPSQFFLHDFCQRMRTTEHAPRDPRRLLERRHCLAEIVERGASVVVERLRVKRPRFERQSISFSENAPRNRNRLAQQRLSFFESP